MNNQIGLVIIGRNEGQRLIKCFKSAQEVSPHIVYVDSGSSDNSVKTIASLGGQIVELSTDTPFTAARARNKGFERLTTLNPEISYVQFIDGDCELISGWLHMAQEFLASNEQVAITAGRLRERYPDKSIYNRLCDIEWDTETGDTGACGGIAMMKVAAFKSVNGFNPELIAGEEPELCLRLRGEGWKVWRLDTDMAWHDAAMSRFSQWWKRTKRAGYAFASGEYLHRSVPGGFWGSELRSILLWGLAIPGSVISLTGFFGLWTISILVIYPIQILRLALKGNRDPGTNFIRAVFLVMGKFPELSGVFGFYLDRLSKNTANIIEYK